MNVDKLIVSNKSRLKAKYGGNLPHIESILKQLIESDKNRGIITKVVYLDSTQVNTYNATPIVSNYEDERQNKRTIDKLFNYFKPDYLMILGSKDVIPHIWLKNIIQGDQDTEIDSDLPYACEKAFSRNIKDYISPTRVVGRLPDITGGNDHKYLVGLISNVINSKPKPLSDYSTYFGLSTKKWQGSTRESIMNIFGTSNNVLLAPPFVGPTSAQMKNRIHFFNCHGDTLSNEFYGEDFLGNQPAAFNSGHISNSVPFGTVVAAECCYGAELYNPNLANGKVSVCNTYLENNSIAYLGSTTIAYGPADGQGLADIITQDFIINVRGGSSIGRAFLQARQDFIHRARPYIDATELKTIAQFILLGDPSVHPVKAAEPKTAIYSKSIGVSANKGADRKHRRKELEEIGKTLAKIIDAPVLLKESVLQGAMKMVNEALKKFEFKQPSVSSFTFKNASLLEGKHLRSKKPVHHVYLEKTSNKYGFSKTRLLVVKDTNSEPIISLYESK
ncbi:MAG: hypothetical protein IPH66_06790 [Crocinitomicaceae bacterium]|nr:hypothetical protein [Crocinitomicaceae bacterium]